MELKTLSRAEAPKIAHVQTRGLLGAIQSPAIREMLMERIVTRGYVVPDVDPENASEDDILEAFQRIQDQHAEVRAYLRDSTDNDTDKAIYLVNRFPQVFLSIERVYRIMVDWRFRGTRRTIRSNGSEGDTDDQKDTILRPPDFWKYIPEADVPGLAQRRLRRDVREFNRDPEGYLGRIRSEHDASQEPRERQAIEMIVETFEAIAKMTFPDFHDRINGAERRFPSMHVRIWIRDLIERGYVLIAGGVGTEKTSAAVVGLHAVGAKRVLVTARSYAAENVWSNEVAKYYRNPPKVLVVRNATDLRRLQAMTAETLRSYSYVVVGYGDLQAQSGDCWVRALAPFEPDAIIVDEAHAINHDIDRSRRVIELARLPSIRFRVLLTATPFECEPNEMANIAMLVMPEEYPVREAFEQRCRNNPRFLHKLMEDMMCAYFDADDVSELPPCNWGRFLPLPVVEIEPCAAAKAAHDMILNDVELDPIEQIRRMNQLLACPYLGRNWYEYPPSVNGYLRDPLKSDKLLWLKSEIERRIPTGKVVVGSGLYTAGVTRKLTDADDPNDDYAVVAMLRQWFGDEVVLVLDGTTSQSESPKALASRKNVMHRWQNDPKARILVASVRATAESVNLTLRKSPGCDKLSVLMLTLPWNSTQLFQFLGRFRRPGMELPTELLVPVLRGLADEPMAEMIRKKDRNFLIGVQGIRLTQEEERAIERMTIGEFLKGPQEWMKEVVYGRVRGLGERRATAVLDGTHNGKAVGEKFARYYLADEETTHSGDVSRFLGKVYGPWLREGRVVGDQILDAACGPLTLERRLGEPVFGIDLNPCMIDVARPHSYNAGKNARVGRLSDLPAEWDGTFRLSVCSLALHWSSNKGGWNKSERVRILRNLARVTATDGIVHLVFLGMSFSEEMLGEWVAALGALGLARVPELTGLIKSVDSPKRPRTFWSVCLQKVGEPTDEEGNAEALRFANERGPKAESVRVVVAKGKEPRERAPQTPVKHEAFVIENDEGTKTPESASTAVAKLFKDATFVDILRREYRPCEEWIKLLAIELNRARPTKLTHFSKLWDGLFHRKDAPKMKREQFRDIARRAMALEPSP